MKLFELEHRQGFPRITGLHGLESYSAAYWRAAKGMIDSKLFDGRGRPDFSTFPIAFLYRHALELMLKAILLEYHEVYSKKPDLLLRRNHKLMKDYLEELRSVVDTAGVLTNGKPVVFHKPEEWSHLQNVLNEWQECDPDGMAFRYSFGKKRKDKKQGDPVPKGEPQFPNHNFTFNIERFAETMEQALEFIAGLKDGLDKLRYHDGLQTEVL